MKLGYAAIYFLHIGKPSRIKLAGPPLDVGKMEQWLKQADDDYTPITQAKKSQHKNDHKDKNTEQAPKERVHLLCINQCKKHCGRTPQTNVRKNVHHGIEHH